MLPVIWHSVVFWYIAFVGLFLFVGSRRIISGASLWNTLCKGILNIGMVKLSWYRSISLTTSLKHSSGCQVNVVTKQLEPHVSFWKMRFPRIMISVSVILLLVSQRRSSDGGRLTEGDSTRVELRWWQTMHKGLLTSGTDCCVLRECVIIFLVVDPAVWFICVVDLYLQGCKGV